MSASSQKTVLASSRPFRILGLQQIDRPDLGFPGAWLQLGAQQIHLLELDNPDPIIEKVWVNEVEKRLKAYKTGKAKTVSFENMFKNHL